MTTNERLKMTLVRVVRVNPELGLTSSNTEKLAEILHRVGVRGTLSLDKVREITNLPDQERLQPTPD